MAELRFLAACTFQSREVAMMAATLRRLSGRGCSTWPPLARQRVQRVLSLLEASLSDPGPAGGQVSIPKDTVLDGCAFLLEAADQLHLLRQHAEALALEGIEGRFMEALVGASGSELSA